MLGAKLPSATRTRSSSPKRATPSATWSPTTWPWPTGRCAAPAAGRWRSSVSSTAPAASSSSRSAPRITAGLDRDGRAVTSRPAGPPTRSSCATRRSSRGSSTWAASISTRTRFAPRISTIPTSCASISTRSRASRGTRSARVALVTKSVLEDVGLVGWPKTSGSRGIHINVRIEPRVDLRPGPPGGARDRSRSRAASAGHRDEQVVERGAPRRLPRLQPERQGPHGCLRVFDPATARRAGFDATALGPGRRS